MKVLIFLLSNVIEHVTCFKNLNGTGIKALIKYGVLLLLLLCFCSFCFSFYLIFKKRILSYPVLNGKIFALKHVQYLDKNNSYQLKKRIILIYCAESGLLIVLIRNGIF